MQLKGGSIIFFSAGGTLPLELDQSQIMGTSSRQIMRLALSSSG